MQPPFYSRLRQLLSRAEDPTVPLVRPTVSDVFTHSDQQTNAIVTDPNLDSRQRVELLLALDSLVRVALAARGEARQVFTSRPAPTPAKRWVVRGGVMEAVA